MFIDKQITVSEKDAREFRRELEENRIPVSGGSMCMYDGLVQELKKAVEDRTYGVVYGGSLRSPVSLDNIYGGFYFYSKHIKKFITLIKIYYNSFNRVFIKKCGHQLRKRICGRHVRAGELRGKGSRGVLSNPDRRQPGNELR